MDKKDMDSLCENNMNLVHSLAAKFRGRGIEYDELFSAGCLGLVKAAVRFNPDLGYAFSTYAVPVILGEIKKVFRDSGTVKVSRDLKDKLRRLKSVREEIECRQGSSATISQLASEMDMSISDVAEIMGAEAPVSSLEVEVPDDGCFEDVVVSRGAVSSALSELAEEDRLLLFYRYFENLTQSQTGALLGMSQVKVSRRENNLLSSLKLKLD